jgi:uncharacterized lipoprotein YbaY
MSFPIGIPTRLVQGFSAGLVLGLSTGAAMAQTIQGTATFKERMALPPDAVLEATLEDVSRADAPAETIARARVASPGNPPIAFTLTYDPSKINPKHRYVVRARILVGEKPFFTTDTAAPVITGGSPTKVSLMLRRAGGTKPQPPGPQTGTSLDGTRWNAVELAGKPVPALDSERAPHLVFQTEGRVAGSDGCNRVAGTYQLEADAVTFGHMIGTQMACPDTGEIEKAFRIALSDAKRLTRTGNRLELFDAKGTRVAAFSTRVEGGGAAATGLAGTSWRLVRFAGGDDTILMPGDPDRYTIQFVAGGQLVVRIDCNRGRGTWKSSEASQLEFGPLALTRMQCPEGSLHDRIVQQWPFVRSYVIRNGHLHLSLMADGGIYEFEPLSPKKK